jgi:hypothetical protein
MHQVIEPLLAVIDKVLIHLLVYSLTLSDSYEAVFDRNVDNGLAAKALAVSYQ